MEEPTLAARNVLMTILPQFLYFMISCCKSKFTNVKFGNFLFLQSSQVQVTLFDSPDIFL